MAFNTTPGITDYTAVLNQDTFTFSFKIYEDADIVFYHRPVTGLITQELLPLVQGVDYVVSSINGDLGGVITMDPTFVMTADDRVIIQRKLSVDRLVNYQTSGDLLADTLNLDQEYQTYLIADIYAELTNFQKNPLVPGIDFSIPMPEADGFIQWNNTGDALENYLVPGGVIGNLLSDGSIPMDSGYIPTSPQKIATLQAVIDRMYDDTGIQNHLTTLDASNAGKQDVSEKGSANGYAGLDSVGLVPAAQLPSYVDDVLEFANMASFPNPGEPNKIYIALDTHRTYRWTGSTYGELVAGVILGETSTTAYRGDKGKAAYDHSLVVTGNPHQVTKADVGLGDVENNNPADAPISTAVATALALKLDKTQVEDSLTSAATLNALSANMGRILNDKITPKIEATDYAQTTIGGTVKARYEPLTFELYLTNDGTNP